MAKLTIKDRFELMKYTNLLPCTLALRIAIDSFNQKLELTDEESKQFDVSFDDNKNVVCNNPDYTIEVDNIPEEILKVMKSYVLEYDSNEEFKNNHVVKAATTAFKKVI